MYKKLFKIHILTETPCNYGTCRLKFKPPICSRKFAQAHKTLHKNNAPEAHLLPTPRFWVTAWQHTAPPNKSKITAIISKCVQNFTHIIFCGRILTTFHLSMHFFRIFFFFSWQPRHHLRIVMTIVAVIADRILIKEMLLMHIFNSAGNAMHLL